MAQNPFIGDTGRNPALIYRTAQNILAETFPRTGTHGTNTLGTGNIRFGGLFLAAGDAVTSLGVFVSTAGSGLTLARIGLYTKDGVLLGASASNTAGFQATGWKIEALAAPVTIPQDGLYYAGVLNVGTTGATITVATSTGAGGASPFDQPTSSGIYRLAGTQSGQADLPATATIAGGTGVLPFVVAL